MNRSININSNSCISFSLVQQIYILTATNKPSHSYQLSFEKTKLVSSSVHTPTISSPLWGQRSYLLTQNCSRSKKKHYLCHGLFKKWLLSEYGTRKYICCWSKCKVFGQQGNRRPIFFVLAVFRPVVNLREAAAVRFGVHRQRSSPAQFGANQDKWSNEDHPSRRTLKSVQSRNSSPGCAVLVLLLMRGSPLPPRSPRPTQGLRRVSSLVEGAAWVSAWKEEIIFVITKLMKAL